jgi:hypothetical protein
VLEEERKNLEREKSVLELERAKQELMLKDGRLVERSVVAAELSRYVPLRVLSSHSTDTHSPIPSLINP